MSVADRAPIFAAVEAGGTKMVCGVGTSGGSRETARIPTLDPAGTIRQILDFFEAAAARHGSPAAAGIASFGPLDLDPKSPTYGSITTTPKPGWSGVDLRGILGDRLGIRAAIDTDVNAAALAEARVGAGRGCHTVAYATIGTGIGVGVALDGMLRHPDGYHGEAGHLIVRRHPQHGDFAGVCPYHGDCLEGLAAGPAIIAAWGESLETLPPEHPAWEAEADYIGQLCAGLTLTLAPDRIVLGGGVLSGEALLPRIVRRTHALLGGYVARLRAVESVAALIVPPGCGEPPGLVGAYLLAEAAAGREGA